VGQTANDPLGHGLPTGGVQTQFRPQLTIGKEEEKEPQNKSCLKILQYDSLQRVYCVSSFDLFEQTDRAVSTYTGGSPEPNLNSTVVVVSLD